MKLSNGVFSDFTLSQVLKSGGVSINNIKKSLDISDYKVRKCVESLDGRHLVRKEGNGPSTRYFVGFESIEFLTQLQIMMDSLKKQMV